MVAAACGTDSAGSPTTVAAATTTAASQAATTQATASATTATTASTATTAVATTSPAADGELVSLRADVWADNWFALYINGTLVGEDTVPITTERSFNAETFTFEATLPLTIAIEAKDFKENDTGLEYIGTDSQQMGDGGIIAQIIDTETGDVVAATDGTWSAFVVHRAPTNKDCERSANPATDCLTEIADVPAGWTDEEFDDSSWMAATVWSEADVSPKDGYDQIDWNAAARLVWGTDLETDNTVLLRSTTGS